METPPRGTHQQTRRMHAQIQSTIGQAGARETAEHATLASSYPCTHTELRKPPSANSALAGKAGRGRWPVGGADGQRVPVASVLLEQSSTAQPDVQTFRAGQICR